MMALLDINSYNTPITQGLSMEKECLRCSKKIGGMHISIRKFCSQKCRGQAYKAKFLENNIRFEISTSSMGTISELRVCIDLLSKGYHVFKNVSPNGWCDLVFIDGSKIYTLEVTTGHFTHTGKLIHPKNFTKQNREDKKFDFLAVVTTKGEIFYFPELIKD